jgi:DNA repair protein RecN (Recombination protein N)
MLENLYIKNYVIIKELNVKFEKGFTSLTGETGAGKSILLGALSLIMGKRADTSVLLNNEKKCIIEAVFNIENYKLENFFDENNLDFDKNTIIRREININGKSRAFVNDSPVNINTLKSLTEKLIDIHAQNNQQLLKNKQFYFMIIDNLGNLTSKVEEYKIKYNKLKNLEKQYAGLLDFANKQKQEQDYLQFRYKQIENAELQENEQENLEIEFKKLSNAGEIKQELTKAYFQLYEDENNIIAQLKYIQQIYENLSSLGINSEFEKRIKSVIIELGDIAEETGILNNSIELDNFKLSEIEERLNLIYDLQQKFGVNSIKELIDIKNEIEQKLLKINNSDVELLKLNKQISELKTELLNIAKQISEQRQKTAAKNKNAIEKILTNLGIKNAVFNIEINLV